MFEASHTLKANEYYKSLVKYPDKYYNEICNFLSGYYAIREFRKEDIKRFIEKIDNVKNYPSSHSSLYVLQSFLFDVLNYSFKPKIFKN